MSHQKPIVFSDDSDFDDYKKVHNKAYERKHYEYIHSVEQDKHDEIAGRFTKNAYLNIDAEKDKSSSFHKFITKFSGYNNDVLYSKEIPEHNRNKAISLSKILFLAAFYGGFSVFLFSEFATENMYIRVISGILGCIFFANYDAGLVQGITNKWTFKTILLLIIRIAFSLSIGFFTAQPIEKIVLGDTIEKHKFEMLQKEKDSIIKQKELEIKNKTNEISLLDNKVELERNRVDLALKEYNDECVGRAGTGRYGIGVECLRRKGIYEKIDNEFKDFLKKIDSEKELIRNKTDDIEKRYNNTLNKIENKQPRDLLSFINAIHEIAQENNTFLFIYLLLTFLLSCIELFPVLLKLNAVGSEDEYEMALEKIKTITSVRNKSDIEFEIENNKNILIAKLNSSDTDLKSHKLNEDGRLRLKEADISLKIYIKEANKINERKMHELNLLKSSTHPNTYETVDTINAKYHAQHDALLEKFNKTRNV